MMLRVTTTVCLALFLAGCHKESKTPSPPLANSSDSTEAPAGAPQAPTPLAAAPRPPGPGDRVQHVAITGDGEDAIPSMVEALHTYVVAFHRIPTYEEFVASGVMSRVPEAPPGKKFAINPSNGKITLAKQ